LKKNRKKLLSIGFFFNLLVSFLTKAKVLLIINLIIENFSTIKKINRIRKENSFRLCNKNIVLQVFIFLFFLQQNIHTQVVIFKLQLHTTSNQLK